MLLCGSTYGDSEVIARPRPAGHSIVLGRLCIIAALVLIDVRKVAHSTSAGHAKLGKLNDLFCHFMLMDYVCPGNPIPFT